MFEFQCSGMTAALLGFVDAMHEDLVHRIRLLLDAAITAGAGHESPVQPLATLIRLLCGCVDKTETFNVMLHSSVTNLGVSTIKRCV